MPITHHETEEAQAALVPKADRQLTCAFAHR